MRYFVATLPGGQFHYGRMSTHGPFDAPGLAAYLDRLREEDEDQEGFIHAVMSWATGVPAGSVLLLPGGGTVLVVVGDGAEVQRMDEETKKVSSFNLCTLHGEDEDDDDSELEERPADGDYDEDDEYEDEEEEDDEDEEDEPPLPPARRKPRKR